MPDTATFDGRLKKRGREVEYFLAHDLYKDGIVPELYEAMRYSLLGGGKLLRPVLCLSSAALFGVETHLAMPFACALEMIHTYSLIHDDLPAMDNDDLRRGRPTCHKAFDEATAILAGDALLTDAFALMASCAPAIPAHRVLAALREIALAAGSPGMVGGQMLDMAFTGKTDIKIDALQRMHSLKTGALFKSSCLTGALLGGAEAGELSAITEYGYAIGLAFQIIDDILDVIGERDKLGKSVGKDVQQGKVTYPALVGLEQSRVLADQAVNRAVLALGVFSGSEADFLKEFAVMLTRRLV
jgi:geranylgeranyl diphosphate synthase type II